MKTQTTDTVVTGLNGLEGIMIERPMSRRNLLRTAIKGLGLAAAAGFALPAARTLAASTSGADALAELSQSPQTGGLELLRAWSAGQLSPNWLPGDGWQQFQQGALTFMVPGGWDIAKIAKDGQSGIWVNAPDTSCGFGATQMVVTQAVNARDGAVWQIGQITGTDVDSAIYDDYLELGSQNSSFVAVQLDTLILAVHCIAVPTNQGIVLNFWSQFGSTDIFDAATEQIFLPFMCQFAAAGLTAPGGYILSNGGGGSGSGGSTGGGSGSGGYSSGGSDGGYTGSGTPGDVINPNDCVYARDPGSAGDVINPDQCTVYTDSNGDDYYTTNSGEEVYTDTSSGYVDTSSTDSGYSDSSYSSYDDSGE